MKKYKDNQESHLPVSLRRKQSNYIQAKQRTRFKDELIEKASEKSIEQASEKPNG